MPRAFGARRGSRAQKRCAAEKTTAFLPLDKAKIKTIGVIGPNANDRRSSATTARRQDISRCWRASGLCRRRRARAVRRGVATSTKTAWRGLGLPGDRLSEAETVAEHSDVVVLVTGLNEILRGRGDGQSNSVGSGDKGGLLLPAPQKLREIVANPASPSFSSIPTAPWLRCAGKTSRRSAGAGIGARAARCRLCSASIRRRQTARDVYNDSDELPAFTVTRWKTARTAYFTGGVVSLSAMASPLKSGSDESRNA